jgi:uncharacterized protein (DUF302 family)
MIRSGLTLAALISIAAPAISGELVLRPSKYGVAETLDRLVAALEAKGIKPAARIDHAAAAAATGMTLLPTQVLLFGNPKLGTPLMQANREVAIDLPMRVVAFEEAGGQVMIGYVAPAAIKTRHALSGVDPQIEMMGKALEDLVKAAAE